MRDVVFTRIHVTIIHNNNNRSINLHCSTTKHFCFLYCVKESLSKRQFKNKCLLFQDSQSSRPKCDKRSLVTTMENIYKIKIRSNPNPRDLYPSERRYSSSIVLGLSIMFIALAITSTLMGTLVVRRITNNNTLGETIFDQNATNSTEEFLEDQRFLKRVEADLLYPNKLGHTLNIPAIVSGGVFVMSLGHFLAGLTGILAWKHWYIDNNITWFFLSSCFASLTSSIALLLVSLALIDTKEVLLNKESPISLGLTANIFITSLLGVIWSVVATNVAFKGMKNNYPDDIILSKSGKGRIEVSTIRKGNRIAKVVPPDILDHFPKSGKLAKFFPKNENNGCLPKAESNKEYEERVKKFLSGESDNCSKN